MKPDWFVCEKCLWWESFEMTKDETVRRGDCHHTALTLKEVKAGQPGENWFCENWTCANCWASWRDEVSYDYLIINHNDCESRKFE